MAIIVTSFRRQIVMVVLLVLATGGAVIRNYAPDPSTLHDVGTLLLVLWLPAVGNLVAFVVRKMPRRAPPVLDFPAGKAFEQHLQVLLQPASLPADMVAALAPGERRCTLLVDRQGFTARLPRPLTDTFEAKEQQTVPLELLHPEVAWRKLVPGTHFHLVVGRTGVARGSVVAVGAAG